ncbi:MAG TPA: hypothetical protein VMT11_08825 [Myxococcaceae bacterium]|nr:hypothetical protein [Myxococcaceae bacterium]
MHLRKLFQVLVLGGGALVAGACGGDTAVRPSPGNGSQQQTLPDGGVMTPAPMPGGGGGGGTGGGMGGPPGW